MGSQAEQPSRQESISRSVEGAGRSGQGNVWASSVAPASSTQRTFRSNTAESLTVTQSSLTLRTLGVSSDFLILGLIDETSHFNEFFLRISMSLYPSLK